MLNGKDVLVGAVFVMLSFLYFLRIDEHESWFNVNQSRNIQTWYSQEKARVCECRDNNYDCSPKSKLPSICTDQGYNPVETTCRAYVQRKNYVISEIKRKIPTTSSLEARNYNNTTNHHI